MFFLLYTVFHDIICVRTPDTDVGHKSSVIPKQISTASGGSGPMGSSGYR